MSLYQQLYARWDGSRLAFSDCTYTELHHQVLGTVHWLRQKGISKGDIICVQLPKSRRLLLLLLAGLAMGSPVLPLNDKYTAQEVLYYLRDVRANLAILMESTEWGGNSLQTLSTCISYQCFTMSRVCLHGDTNAILVFDQAIQYASFLGHVFPRTHQHMLGLVCFCQDRLEPLHL